MISLIRLLQSLSPMSADLVTHFYEIIEHKEMEKKEYLLKSGETCHHAYYIKKGMIRCYLMNDQEEVTLWILKEGDVIVSPVNFYAPHHREYIQCIEKSELLYISNNQLNNIYQSFPEFNVTVRLLTEKYNVLLSRYNYITRIRPTEDRYRYFLEHFPDLSERVQVKDLASFLGMSVYHFSRLRRSQQLNGSITNQTKDYLRIRK